MRFFKLLLLPFILLMLFGPIPLVHADKGGFPIVVRERVSVSESGQKAIIAWNGTHEVLILSTDVKSTKESEVVEIMPLPSNPTISKGEKLAFFNIKNLVNDYFEMESMLSGLYLRYGYRYAPGMMGVGGVGTEEPPKITITFHATIGVHDITAVNAEEASELIRWLRNFLETKGYEGELPSNLEELLQHYMKNGMKFFVIDMINTIPTVRTIDPLIYEFESSKLYYPLRISTLFSGDTEISLFTLTSGVLDDYSIIKEGFVKKAQFQIKQEALAKISQNITQLFSGDPYLCYFSFAGSLEEFNGDILASSKLSFSNIFTMSLVILIPSSVLLCLLLLLLSNKLFSHLGNNRVKMTRLLEIVSFVLGVCGIFLAFIGCWFFPWGLKVYEDLFIPIHGPADSLLAYIITVVIVYSISFVNPLCIYWLFSQKDSREAPLALITEGTCMMLLVLGSCTYYLNYLGIGGYIMLTSCLFIILAGLLMLMRVKLLTPNITQSIKLQA